MELRHLRYFLALADEGNFTRAAGKLGIGQPPLSQQIRDLETEIGVQLFHRVPHGAELTAAGEAFLPEAQAAIDAAERAKLSAQRANRGETGRLALGFTASSAFNTHVSGAIRQFRKRWPEVRLSLTEMNSKGLMERLMRGEIDAAFIRPGLENPREVRLRMLAVESMVIALPTGHRLAAAPRLPLSALAEEQFILFPRVAGLSLYDDIAAACREAGSNSWSARRHRKSRRWSTWWRPISASRSFRPLSPRSSSTASSTAKSTARLWWHDWAWPC